MYVENIPEIFSVHFSICGSIEISIGFSRLLIETNHVPSQSTSYALRSISVPTPKHGPVSLLNAQQEPCDPNFTVMDYVLYVGSRNFPNIANHQRVILKISVPSLLIFLFLAWTGIQRSGFLFFPTPQHFVTNLHHASRPIFRLCVLTEWLVVGVVPS